jgi:acid phosphatase type 7
MSNPTGSVGYIKVKSIHKLCSHATWVELMPRRIWCQLAILGVSAVVHCGSLHALDETSGSPVTVIAAGDIAECRWGNPRGAEATARLIETLPGTVLALGDLTYPDGAKAEYDKCYEPTWGRFKSRTRPTLGNHEYNSLGARPYFSYWGQAAGSDGDGFYSFDVGNWHLVALNSNIVASTSATRQESWLKQDLNQHQGKCTLAFFHHPRFSSGWHRDNPRLDTLWRILYKSNVDVVLNGHEHNYERFAPLDPDGRLDERRGIREFIVGTGGAQLIEVFLGVHANSEARESTSYGVLALALASRSYEWQFLSAPGGIPLDRGSASCHGVVAND